MAKGRKRKSCRREPNGKPSRKGIPRLTIDKGTERLQMKQEDFGTEGADAIGRAFMAGLLGEDGGILKDHARKLFSAYWPMMEVGRYNCTLNDRSGGSNDNFDPEAVKLREKWLNKQLATADKMGRTQRKVFDQLVIDMNPDSGPSWLDSLIWHKAHGRSFPRSDQTALDMAVGVLRKLAY